MAWHVVKGKNDKDGREEMTHCKFILRMFFSFSERPRVLELLHFIGSIKAKAADENNLK